MAVGETNFDDWAARQQVAYVWLQYGGYRWIRCCYKRTLPSFLWIDSVVHEHGVNIARADLKPLEFILLPQIRRNWNGYETGRKDGDRYYFIHAEEHSRQHLALLQQQIGLLIFALEAGFIIYTTDSSRETVIPELPGTRKLMQLKPLAGACQIQTKLGEWTDEIPTRWTIWKGEGGLRGHL